MRKRLLSTILMVVILITSIQIDAFALPDDYNANNFIVDKTEQYGGSHLVITNTSTSSGQPTGVLPIAGSVEDAVPLNDMDGEADEDVYGYDGLGQGLIDPASFLPELGEDLISQSSSQMSGVRESVSTTAYEVGTTKTLYLMNQYSSNTYATECICVAVGEYCTVWIPKDDPYYVACMEAASASASVEKNDNSLQPTTDTVSGNTVSGNTVSGNEIVTEEGTVSGNEILSEENADEALQNTAMTDNAMVKAMETLAVEFDSKHADMVDMFGDTKAADATGRGDADGKTAIICYDIYGDFSKGASSYVAGYFWGADLKGYSNSTGNAMDCIHIDSYQGMGRAKDYSIDLNYIDNCYSTLVHELQHMIHYSHLEEKGLGASYTPTYLNETFSAAAEHLMYGLHYSRTSYYNYYDSFKNGLSLTQWGSNSDVLMNYSVAYLFSQYIRTQYIGVKDETGSTIYRDAMEELSYGKDLLDIIAEKIGTTKKDIWLNFRTALELKNPTGPYGFAGDTSLTYYINSKIYTASTDSIDLPPGGSIVIAIDEPYTPPSDAGTELKYLGIDLGRKEQTISVSFAEDQISEIDSYRGTLELNTTISPYYLSQDVTYSIVSGEEYATISDNMLTAMEDGEVVVRATWNEKKDVYTDYTVKITGQDEFPITVTEEAGGNTVPFMNLNEAVAHLDTVAEKATGTYIFTFGTNIQLTEDVTLPSYVTEAVFATTEYVSGDTAIAENEGNTNREASRLLVTLDFSGNKLTTDGKLTIEEGLLLSDSKEGAVINLTGSNAAGWDTEASLLFRTADTDTSFVDVDGVEVNTDKRAEFVKNVTISAPKTAVELYRSSNNTIAYTAQSDITAQVLRISDENSGTEPAGVWNIQGGVSVDVLDLQESGDTTLKLTQLSASTGVRVGDGDVLYVNTASGIKDLQLLSGSVFIADNFNQISSGKTYLWADSTLIINDSAAIYNPVIDAEGVAGDKPVHIYKAAEAQINILGTIIRTSEQTGLSFGKLQTAATDAESIVLQDFSGQTALFETMNSSFPMDIICVQQSSEESISAYNMVYKIGNTVYVGIEGITVKSVGVSDGEEEVLKSFAKWSDAAAYLETLSNTPMEYIVEFSDNLDINENLTLPKKVNGITFRGADSNRIRLTYTGDIKLESDTAFENIDLTAKKYNNNLKRYESYQSAVTLNGKTLTIRNASAQFASIAGNTKSKVILEAAKVDVTKAVTSLGYLDMMGTVSMEDGNPVTDTSLRADSVTVTDTLTMKSSTLDCTNKITLKDVVTEDANNILSYGGNSSKDVLTITGTVTSSDSQDMIDETVNVRRTETTAGGTQNIEDTATVRKNAIRLQVKSMEPDAYEKEALLCNATKAGAGWFVVGTTWENVGSKNTRVISYAAYKKNNAIYCGNTVENVKLYSSNSDNGTFAYESSFATLQDALTEIDKLAVNTAYYRIELIKADENVVTFSNKVPTFPSKTAGITIAADPELASPNLYFKGNLNLKSNVTFEDITFVPETKSTISLGNYALRLECCHVDITRSGVGFSGITGSNVNGASALILDDTALQVAGNVNAVGTLIFTGEETGTYALLRTAPAFPTLIADGTVNVGSIELEKDGYLTGLATITRKNGYVTKIMPQITINNEVESAGNKTLYLDLQEKVFNQYVSLDFDSSEMNEIRKEGISLAKALYTTYPNIKAAQRNNEASLTKSGSYLTYFEDGFGVMLSYKSMVKTLEEASIRTIEIPCRTFADAVTEINNQKVKRDYTITLLKGITKISGVDQNGSHAVPKALTMPNKNYVDTLTIRADDPAEDIKLGFINNITLTSNLILENVQFVQMTKVGSVYQTSDYAKDNYPAAVTFNTAGYDITIIGKNTFNTPLILNGGNKGNLTFDEQGTITTLTNNLSVSDGSVKENVIYGMITGFDAVTVDNCNLTLNSYKASQTSTSYNESKNKIITINVTGTVTVNEGERETSGNIIVVSKDSKAEFTCTNFNSDNGNLLVDGKVSLKNVTLEGEMAPTIHADTNFDITGTLISRSNSAVLETRLKGAGKEPYLNVSGTVVRVGNTYPIYVGVYFEITAENHTTAVNMKKDGKSMAQLLSAKNARAGDFRPIEANYSGGEYSPEGEENYSGYMMLKLNGRIYVYDGNQVRVAVYKGNYRSGNGELVGYYPSFKEATAEVDSLKDKTQKYTYVLTQQNGSVAAPVSILLPTQAESVIVTSLAGSSENETVYVSGNVTLKCNTVFEKLEFAPVYRNAGTAFSIAAGGYDVALKDVSVSDELEKMALKDISGNGKQTVVLASCGLTMTGSLTNAAQAEVTEDTVIKGNVKAAVLSLDNNTAGEGTVLAVNGTVAADTLENSGSAQNILEYARDPKNNTNLTINKDIINHNDGNLIVLKQSNAAVLPALSRQNGKVTLTNAAKALTLPKASTDSFVLQTQVSSASQTVVYDSSVNNTYTVVKSDKGVYLANSTLQKDIVLLTRIRSGEGAEADRLKTNCLDYTQAVNEINTLADIQSSYEIQFLSAGSYTAGSEIDTNVKDTNPYGTFTLPKSNAKKALVVKGVSAEKTILPFSGNISGQGTVTLQDLVLNPVKSGTDSTPADTKITITTDNTSAMLVMDNISTKTVSAVDAKTPGFITSISGTKNKTDILLKDCGNLLVKSGITNINTVSLDGTKLLSDGNIAVNRVELQNNASWVSLGKMTVTDVYVSIPSGSTAASYIGTKQDKNGNTQFTLNGDVYEADGSNAVLLCKLYQTDTTIEDGNAIFSGSCGKALTEYANKPLVSAKKACADKFRAYPFRDADLDGNIVSNTEDITKDNLVAYKDGVNVKNGNMSAMQVKIVEHARNAEGEVLSTSYAVSFEDAVTAINNKADMAAFYELQFIQEGTEVQPVVIKTAKKGTEYGAFTLPSKAAGIRICGYQDGTAKPVTVIKYTGTLKAGCDVTFSHIILTEGKADKKEEDGFAESGAITPAPANNITIAFEKDVYTYPKMPESAPGAEKLVISTVNSNKGHLIFLGNQVTSEGNITVGSLTLSEGAGLETAGKISITDLYADGNADNSITTYAAMSIGNIKNRNTASEVARTAKVRIESCFTKMNKEGTYGNSQLTVSGMIEDADVKLSFQKYDLASKTYVKMNQNDLEMLFVKTDGKPEAYRKLATIPKASTERITVWGSDMTEGYAAFDHENSNTQKYLYKYDTGLYLTDMAPLVVVSGYESRNENQAEYDNLCYQAEFLSWEQAVKEIDKISETTRYYELKLLDTVNTPIGTVAMPSKAAEIMIVSEQGEENGILFTGSGLALKCPTYMKDVGFTCVKKYGSGSDIYYEPVTYTMNIGNYKLIQEDMVTIFASMESKPYTIAGSSKGILEYEPDEKNSIQLAAVKGIDSLIVNENFTLDCTGELSTKNLVVTDSTVQAKNITVSTLATLDGAVLQAGTAMANDGKMTLKDIKLAGSGNTLTAKQDKNGATQITINGTITAADHLTEAEKQEALSDGTLTIALYYNNFQKQAQLYNGMILCNAPKAASSLFTPAYTVTEISVGGITVTKAGMGRKNAGYGMYKSGKGICYGAVAATAEVMLEIGTTGMTTYFASFEEAVKEIDSLGLYKNPEAKTKEYEDYTITLLSDVEIGNVKKNNIFSALLLPSKAKELTVDGNPNSENGNMGYTLSFGGNVSIKCNTVLSDITLYPIKNVKGEGVKTAANYAIGNFTLELDNMTSKDDNGISLIGNVTGSSKTGTFKLSAGAADNPNQITVSQLSGLRDVVLEEYTQLQIDKNCSVYQITFSGQLSEGALAADAVPVLAVNETLTTTLVNAEDADAADNIYGIIRKPIASKMTVNGLYEDRDKDKIKEYYSLLFPVGVDDGCIKVELVGLPCPAGTLVLTGKYLNLDETQDNIKVISKRNASGTGASCITYSKGTNLYIGEKEE